MIYQQWAGLAAACLLLLVSSQLCSATPSLWVGNHLKPQPTVPNNLQCTSHPTAQFSHPAPITNQGIAFSLSNIAGVVSSVCPGSYQLTSLVLLPADKRDGEPYKQTAAAGLPTQEWPHLPDCLRRPAQPCRIIRMQLPALFRLIVLALNSADFAVMHPL